MWGKFEAGVDPFRALADAAAAPSKPAGQEDKESLLTGALKARKVVLLFICAV
jgi:hypothetical protein